VSRARSADATDRQPSPCEGGTNPAARTAASHGQNLPYEGRALFFYGECNNKDNEGRR